MSISKTAGLRSPDHYKPLTVPVNTARQLLGIGNTKMWELIKTNRVVTISIGRRRLVVFASLEKLLASNLESGE